MVGVELIVPDGHVGARHLRNRQEMRLHLALSRPLRPRLRLGAEQCQGALQRGCRSLAHGRSGSACTLLQVGGVGHHVHRDLTRERIDPTHSVRRPPLAVPHEPAFALGDITPPHVRAEAINKARGVAHVARPVERRRDGRGRVGEATRVLCTTVEAVTHGTPYLDLSLPGLDARGDKGSIRDISRDAPACHKLTDDRALAVDRVMPATRAREDPLRGDL